MKYLPAVSSGSNILHLQKWSDMVTRECAAQCGLSSSSAARTALAVAVHGFGDWFVHSELKKIHFWLGLYLLSITHRVVWSSLSKLPEDIMPPYFCYALGKVYHSRGPQCGELVQLKATFASLKRFITKKEKTMTKDTMFVFKFVISVYASTELVIAFPVQWDDLRH